MPDDADLIAAAAVLGIPLDPTWHNAIRFHLGLSLRAADLVAEFSLPDDLDPAPVFAA